MSTATDETTEPEAEVVEPGDEPTGDEDEVEPVEEPVEEPDEPEDEAPTAGPAVEEDYAKVFDKAVKRANTYMSAVPTILGESAADLSLCPRCTDFLPGFVLPLNIKPVTDEQKVAVKQSIGELIAAELLQDGDAATCARCDGYGQVLTGSKVPKEAKALCLNCKGRGWVGSRADRLPELPAATLPDGIAVNGDEAADAPLTDPWGRTQDDPSYGVLPGFERV